MRAIIGFTHPENLSVRSETFWIFLKIMASGAGSVGYEFEGFYIDPGKRLLFGPDDKPIPITTKIFYTLLYLICNAGRVIEKDELMSAIWPDTIVEENNLNKNISVLRRLLADTRGE